MYSYVPSPVLESDDELRVRLLYIAGEFTPSGSPTRTHAEIATGSGQALDDIAYRYDLKRRAT